METIIVNLYAGAGAGKTTAAWNIASELKKKNIVTEYVGEYAKELVYDGRRDLLDGSLKNQEMVYAEQKHRIDRLMGKVQVVVTDSPILLSAAYLKDDGSKECADFKSKVISDAKSYKTFSLFINRGKYYEQQGRAHTLTESKAMDNKIKDMLKENNIFFGTYYHKTLDVLISNIERHIEKRKETKAWEHKAENISDKQYEIFQFKDDDNNVEMRFMSYDFLKKNGYEITADKYDCVYKGDMKDKETLDDIFVKFNVKKPHDFKGHSLSVADVIVVNDKGNKNAYFVDSIGFKPIKDFFEKVQERKKTASMKQNKYNKSER